MTINYNFSIKSIAFTLMLLCITNGLSAMSGGEQVIERKFDNHYFSALQPSTAFDMVSRLPGFVIAQSNSNNRGFGQASLNILINGLRPSSKASNAKDILSRIPAKSVTSIEILDGNSMNIPGLSGQIANLIVDNNKLTGNWEYSARFEEGTDPQLNEVSIAVLGSRNKLDYSINVEIEPFSYTEIGDEQFFNGINELIEARIERRRFDFQRPKLDLNIGYIFKNGHLINANFVGTVTKRRRGNSEVFRAITTEGETGNSDSNNREDELEYEIGGDYSMGNLKLIVLHRFENSQFDNDFTSLEDNQLPFNSSFINDVDEAEFIFRPEYNWSTSTANWQWSVEGAFNYLENHSEFNDTDTALTLENVRVEEIRTETNLTYQRQLSAKSNIQVSLGAEFSKIDVATGNELASPSMPGEFYRPKGFIALSYDMTSNYKLLARIDREVDQLNFGTFISTVNLTDDIVNSGNAKIIPSQLWKSEIAIERISTAGLSATLNLFANFIEDPIDRIQFNDGSEGPGNLDSALAYGIQFSGTWQMNSIGLTGTRLEFDISLADSAIDDPITGISRAINDTKLWEYEVSLSRDLDNSPWSWQLEFEQQRESTFFRLDQSFDDRFDKPFTSFALTYKDFFGFKVTASISNLLDRTRKRERLIYDGSRLGRLIEQQIYERQRGRRFNLTISNTF